MLISINFSHKRKAAHQVGKQLFILLRFADGKSVIYPKNG